MWDAGGRRPPPLPRQLPQPRARARAIAAQAHRQAVAALKAPARAHFGPLPLQADNDLRPQRAARWCERTAGTRTLGLFGAARSSSVTYDWLALFTLAQVGQDWQYRYGGDGEVDAISSSGNPPERCSSPPAGPGKHSN